MTKKSNGQFVLDGFEKKAPQMPEGYYSGDRPNPNLRAFVEKHLAERPYDPETDDYDVPPFDKPIETTKATAIYNMHTYWSKKPHDAIREYIRHYTKPGDLVLDPFCGSGGTALAALMEGRKAIAIDRSPAATFITKNYCTPVDVDELKTAFEALKAKVQPEIDWLYETRCERCGGKATTNYTVYSQVFECPRCLEKVALFDCPEFDGETASGKAKKTTVCPHCYEKGIKEEISTRAKKFGSVPVLVSYTCQSGCKPASGIRRHNDADEKKREYFEKYDLGKIREIAGKEIPYWYPKHRMMNVESDTEPWGDKWRAGTSNFRTVAELFTKRNLWALAIYKKYIDEIDETNVCKDALLFSLTSILLKSSRMMAHNNDGIGRIQKGTYYIPQLLHDVHVGKFMLEAVGDMANGYKSINIKNIFTVSTTDSRKLGIANSSIDYIFTDPPYGGTVQYGELNFVWETWLGYDTNWYNDEIIVNSVRKRTESDWQRMMQKAMNECYRVIKPGRCISLCYHDTSEGTWALIQDIMAHAGFIPEHVHGALYIDAPTKTTNQYFSDKVTKRDLVINFRKPKPGEVAASVSLTGQEDAATFADKVRRIIRDYLDVNPGSTKDRVYDEVVSRMVRSGQMEAHDFDALLRQVADKITVEGEKGNSRWYLKETELVIADDAETAREDNAAAKLESFVRQFLHAHPAAEGVHYSDLFEHYIYAVKDKPRRHLADILPDYFYKTDDGTWRLPASDEEHAAKANARAAGLGRRVKRYIALLEAGAAIPEHERQSDATLAEWLRYCKRAGLFAQGKLLYEKGGLNTDNLSEEAMVGVEEDYQACVLMLNRESSAPKKRGTGKK